MSVSSTSVRDTGVTQGYAWDLSQRGDKREVALWCHRDADYGAEKRKRGEPVKTSLDGSPRKGYYTPAYLNQMALKFGWYAWPIEECLSHKFVPMWDVKGQDGTVARRRGVPEFGCPECRKAKERGELPIKAVGIAKSAPEAVLLTAQCFYGGQSGTKCGEIVFGKDVADLKDSLRAHLKTHPEQPSTKRRGRPPKTDASKGAVGAGEAA